MCYEAGEHDSRGPGWYCCRENSYNAAALKKCRYCHEKRCNESLVEVKIPRRTKRPRTKRLLL